MILGVSCLGRLCTKRGPGRRNSLSPTRATIPRSTPSPGKEKRTPFRFLRSK